MSKSNEHNLNIHLYNFNELLNLFGLSHTISSNDMKNAKKKVLMLHPDKSNLPADYFLFYKKAYDIINTFYENQNKQNKTNVNENTHYEPLKQNDLNKSTNFRISNAVKEMSTTEFQQKFNKLFDENMINKIDNSKNNWFTDNNSIYNIDDNVNANNMGEIFNKVKETQKGLVKYKGVEQLYVNHSSGTQIYDDLDNDDYVSCDLFSKLKYDDLRKVHKDQTVFNVSEKDIHKVKQYSSTDELMRSRNTANLNPLDKEEAERILNAQNKQYRELIHQKEYEDKLKTMQYAEKNKNIISSFLRLT